MELELFCVVGMDRCNSDAVRLLSSQSLEVKFIFISGFAKIWRRATQYYKIV